MAETLRTVIPLHSKACDICQHKSESLLCSFSDDLRADLNRTRVNCHYKAGQVIFYSGNDPIGLFAVQSGLVKLEAHTNEGGAHTLRLIGPGGLLGYRSLFANEKYNASAIALQDVELCFLPKTEVMRICAQHPELMIRILSIVSKELRQAENRWMDQVAKGASERIAEAVIFLHDHFDDQTWTRKEIAQWAGTTPETVMRTLSQFEKEGLIQQEGRDIHIRQRLALMERAGLH